MVYKMLLIIYITNIVKFNFLIKLGRLRRQFFIYPEGYFEIPEHLIS